MARLEENDILFAHKALNLVPGLSEAARRVAGAIIDHFNKRTGQCDPSVERLATMLGIDRATVLRATEKLDELGLIEKVSHGGKAHRASYAPNWGRFRADVEDWDARMKTGDGPAKSGENRLVLDTVNVATLRRSRSQDCDVKGRKIATQTLRRNQSKEPIELERVETRAAKPQTLRPQTAQQGLLSGREPPAQRSMFLPISGGRSHSDAARTKAEERLNAALQSLGQHAAAEALEWLDVHRQEAATQAEMLRRGGGLAFIVSSMQGDRRQAHG